ncbi:PREDICTED: membrane-spanning 4-domains subfamily A member 7 isoform X1 [Chinchilla lanigera]|uniref:membrane-spanning 4-domains subfamily A member 7 isoform X1 n=1 Tax=Chinchilla lanigera TaxID=34839 RepID=UPI00038F0A1F|nr:PREDICTED: membrane-spanning 4-domains subfamily A member 7 isoform X1 [Chinchilla lanigera]XP_013361959.1 PREDICTED: membrane-spanning 4-domains subfamily A member 7 isoform X1 [Chinchilla lanigera]
MPVSQMLGASFSIINTMPLHLKIPGAPAGFIPKGTLTLKGEEGGHAKQKEQNPQKDLQMEATVLGVVQITCGLVVLGLGLILASAPVSSRRSPAVPSSVTSGFPLVGGLCFAISGSLSFISGKKSTKPFAKSSLASNAVSCAAAGAGVLLLTCSLAASGNAAQTHSSERECLTSLPYSEYYYSIYELKDCLLADFSLTGTLVVMLIFVGLELLVAAYASVFWYKQIRSTKPGSAFSSLPPQDYVQHIKNASKSWV